MKRDKTYDNYIRGDVYFTDDEINELGLVKAGTTNMVWVIGGVSYMHVSAQAGGHWLNKIRHHDKG